MYLRTLALFFLALLGDISMGVNMMPVPPSWILEGFSAIVLASMRHFACTKNETAYQPQEQELIKPRTYCPCRWISRLVFWTNPMVNTRIAHKRSYIPAETLLNRCRKQMAWMMVESKKHETRTIAYLILRCVVSTWRLTLMIRSQPIDDQMNVQRPTNCFLDQ